MRTSEISTQAVTVGTRIPLNARGTRSVTVLEILERDGAFIRFVGDDGIIRRYYGATIPTI